MAVSSLSRLFDATDPSHYWKDLSIELAKAFNRFVIPIVSDKDFGNTVLACRQLAIAEDSNTKCDRVFRNELQKAKTKDTNEIMLRRGDSRALIFSLLLKEQAWDLTSLIPVLNGLSGFAMINFVEEFLAHLQKKEGRKEELPQ